MCLCGQYLDTLGTLVWDALIHLYGKNVGKNLSDIYMYIYHGLYTKCTHYFSHEMVG